MKETPLLFKTPMVQAILDGSKTMTRRIIKIKKNIDNPTFGFTAFTPEGHCSVRGIYGDKNYGESFIKCPYGKSGDRIWVKETWKSIGFDDDADEPLLHVQYKADDFTRWIPYDREKLFMQNTWKSSMFMPRKMARIFLEITNIRVERLQDISEHNARWEGIGREWDGLHYWYENYFDKRSMFQSNPKLSFQTLWQSINGPDSWNANPWVWVIEFKRISL